MSRNEFITHFLQAADWSREDMQTNRDYMACDDDVIPLQERIETVTDDTDLDEVYNTERQLLYVACTRAREHLLVTGVKPGSEFLDDFQSN